jgi:hypothetical protein
MVGVEVRDHDRVDGLGIEARGGHVVGELSVRALAVDLGDRAIAGIDHHQLAAGIDHQRREVDREDIARQKRLLERGVDLFLLRIGDEGIFQRKGIPAIGDHRDLDVADLVTIEARRLLVGDRRGCARRRKRQPRRGRDSSGSGQCVTSCQFHADVLSL